MTKTVAITTLGCKTNQFESAAMTESLEKEGYRIVPFGAAADIYLINSCTVTAKTDAESRRLIRKSVQQNPAAQVVVTGCYAQLAAEEILALPGVRLVLGNSEKRDVVRLLKDLDQGPRAVVTDIAQERDAEAMPLESFAEHTRAFLQVQNGCDGSCAYCIVPKARGKSRSVPLEQALEGMASFAARGFQEVVLSGIHLGAYGLDLTPPADLLTLLQAMERQGGIPRIRIGSVEPTEIPAALIRHLQISQVVCPHLHIPLQSGSDGVLARMNRGYDGAFFAEVTRALVAAVPEICLGADVIAGFPAETEEEFEEGYRFIESLPLAYLHVFPFSVRPGTAAAAMKPQVQASVIKERARLLRELSERKRRAYLESFVGKELQVLIQKEAGSVKGLSRNYLSVQLEGDAPPVNSEVTVRITGAQAEHLVGMVL